MYTPRDFRIDDPATITAFLQRHSFATLVTCGKDIPTATHLPMLYDPTRGPHGTLSSHMARANPQWQAWDDRHPVLVVFQGPHAYISPSWYRSTPAVPTWNYTAVHAYGTPCVVQDHARSVALLDELIAQYEGSGPGAWSGELSAEYRDKLLPSIVLFEIPLTRIEAKFKLSQNRSADDQASVRDHLANGSSAESRALAAMMHDSLPNPPQG